LQAAIDKPTFEISMLLLTRMGYFVHCSQRTPIKALRIAGDFDTNIPTVQVKNA
jgi:hypothetical protein